MVGLIGGKEDTILNKCEYVASLVMYVEAQLNLGRSDCLI